MEKLKESYKRILSDPRKDLPKTVEQLEASSKIRVDKVYFHAVKNCYESKGNLSSKVNGNNYCFASQFMDKKCLSQEVYKTPKKRRYLCHFGL